MKKYFFILLLCFCSYSSGAASDDVDLEVTVEQLKKQGKFDKAISLIKSKLDELYDDTLKNRLSIAKYENNLGNLYLSTAEYDKAEELFNHVYEILKSDPKNRIKDISILVNNLCIIYMMKNRLQEGVELIEKTLKLLKGIGEEKSTLYGMLLLQLAGFQRDLELYDR